MCDRYKKKMSASLTGTRISYLCGGYACREVRAPRLYDDDFLNHCTRKRTHQQWAMQQKKNRTSSLAKNIFKSGGQLCVVACFAHVCLRWRRLNFIHSV